MDAWEKEEGEFFADLGDEREYDIRAVTYVRLLQQLQELGTQRYQTTRRMYDIVISSGADASSYANQVKSTRKCEARRRYVMKEEERLEIEIGELELLMDINQRWTPATPQYAEAVKYLKERTYHRALEKLQKLVILRLFELHKLNLSRTGKHCLLDPVGILTRETGYKMRTHLAKSLQTRCKAIKKAVDAYNAAAAALTPPRPPVDWSRVSHYGFLEEFHLLQDTRNDIRTKQWSLPHIRNLMKLRQRVVRAGEELQRCTVELRRLHTSIRDEQALFRRVLLDRSGTLIHGAIEDYVIRRSNVNYDS